MENFKTIISSGTALLVLLSLVVEIAPIKVYPLRWIGNRLNADILHKVSNLEVMCIKSCRARILRFGDELRLGVDHSQENYTQILNDIQDYENYCNAHKDFPNGRTVMTVAKIKEEYTHRMGKNDFL